ncbi:MAG: RHS repeat-associated core domain-containing protein [Pyrinomonadaceae bacterium]|nr:RHS repeat-associated core domain-containing protein [Pyrinomonadaceae bacterium]
MSILPFPSSTERKAMTARERTSNSPLAFILVFLVSSFSVLAQEQNQYDKGTPAQHAAGVSPLGSYTTAELGTINLSNGSLNFSLPLGKIGGRGFSIPLTLNYSSKVWSASTDTDEDRAQVQFRAAFAEFTHLYNSTGFFGQMGAGWSVGAAPELSHTIVRIKRINSGPNIGCYTYTLPKLTLRLPGNGEIEFRDDVYDGAPLLSNCDGWSSTTSRGSRWHATDGSGMIYISDINNAASMHFGNLSGVVITSDGTRYRFDGPRCVSITDRNGNRITINYISENEVQYVDQLGRVTKLQENVADPENPGVTLAFLVTLPGYNATNRYYKIKSGVMNQNYRSDINPALPVITGDYDPLSKYPDQSGTKLFPLSYSGFFQRIDNRPVLSELELPDHRSLRFRYNKFGEVAEAQLPTGGKIWYEFQHSFSLPAGNSPSYETSGDYHTSVWIDRALSQRKIFSDGTTLDCTWNYQYTGAATNVGASSPTGELVLSEVHHFMPAGRYTEAPGAGGAHDGTYYNLWSTGIEWRTETKDASGAIIFASEQDWTQRAPVSWSTYPQEQPVKDNRVNSQRRILDDGKIASTTTIYDQFNNPIETSEFDFDTTLKRRTVTSYSATNLVNGVDYGSDSIRLLRLPLEQSIYDVGGIEHARTIYEYDIYAGDPHDILKSYTSITGHDTNYGPGKTTRGNVTRLGRWIKTTNSYLYTYPRYDIVGNVVSAKDARGNISSISFADDFGDGSNPGSGTQGSQGATYALPTLTTSPSPNVGEQPHTSQSQYDFSTGLPTGVKDRNNIITQTYYNDPLNRPTLVKSALGVAGVENHTSVFYAPATVFGITLAKNDVLTVKDQAAVGDAVLRSWTVTDGFGRTKESWSRDPQGDVKAITNYDALGRTSQTSNPFRPSLGETAVYTATAYDLAGRLLTVTTPDNAVVTTSYSGNTVTVQDQAGKQRKSVTDALGRLKGVYEAPNDPSYNYLTGYSYDTLDNLTSVSQGSQTRTFVYDSLKRLTSATNPESGTICFGTVFDGQCQANGYDANGNLIYKTDARGILSTYGYDALNRNKIVDYSDTAINPDITRIYDTAINGKGRLRESYAGGSETVGVSVEHTKIVSYDALGRPLDLRQRCKTSSLWSGEYKTEREYNLSGGVISQIYPSGHKVDYAYDSAGRTNRFSGNLGDGTDRDYATGIIYSPLGGMAKEQFGTDVLLYNKSFYNSRGQLSEIRVGETYTGPTDTGWERGAIINHYSNQAGCWGASCNATDNNGNLRRQDHWIKNSTGGVAAIYTQEFDYDRLNRIQRVKEGTSWQQEYVYDRWGNRTIHQTNTWGVGINKKDFAVNTGNNRLGVPEGQTGEMIYDNAGNLTTDTYSGAAVARAYDAENRMTSETQANGYLAASYTYNADGQRVRRTVGGQPSAVTTWQVYGFDGELLAEYAANTSYTTPQKEYGYRNGQLLITAETGAGTTENVAWTNVVGATVSGNSLTKTAATAWGNAGAASTRSIVSGDGYVEFSVTSLYTGMVALSQTDANQDYTTMEFALLPNSDGNLYVFESGANRGVVSTYTTADRFRVAVEGGVVKYRKNGTLVYTSTVAPTFPLLVDAGLYHNGGTQSNVVISGNLGGSGSTSSNINWLVADQLGTPRMVFDQTGALAMTKRHDYLPFGEELYADTGGRTTGQGYTASGNLPADGARQKFTLKERDIETGLDYFGARYYASTQGRFTGADPYDINIERQNTSDPEEADALFRDYIFQPQHWNRYAYALNNPLRYVDPDGRLEYETELLGKKIKVKISDKLDKKEQDAIRTNIDNAIAKINGGADRLTSEQTKAINSMKGIEVGDRKSDTGMNTESGVFMINPHRVENSTLDGLTGDIIHDSHHKDQANRGLKYNEKTAIEREKEASAFTVGVAERIGLDSKTIEHFKKDAREGHTPFKTKSRPPKTKTP